MFGLRSVMVHERVGLSGNQFSGNQLSCLSCHAELLQIDRGVRGAKFTYSRSVRCEKVAMRPSWLGPCMGSVPSWDVNTLDFSKTHHLGISFRDWRAILNCCKFSVGFAELSLHNKEACVASRLF